jgi:hypothetical protein
LIVEVPYRNGGIGTAGQEAVGLVDDHVLGGVGWHILFPFKLVDRDGVHAAVMSGC